MQNLPDDTVPVWLFDGHCVLCSQSVQFLLRHERDHSVHFVAIQSDHGRKLAVQHGLDPDDPQSFLFIEDGKMHQASDGVLVLLRHLRGFSLLAAPLHLVPRGWRDAAYFWLARNRYRLFGKSSQCLMPTPAQRQRFVLPA